MRKCSKSLLSQKISMRTLLVLALLSSAEALFKGGVSTPKKGASKAAVGRMTGKVVPTGRGAALATEPEPFGEVAQLATDLSITALRVGTCALMVHHGIDKLGVRLYSNAHVLSARACITAIWPCVDTIHCILSGSTSMDSLPTSSRSSSAFFLALLSSGRTPQRRRRSRAPACSVLACSRARPPPQ